MLVSLKAKYSLFIVSNTSKMEYIEAFLKCSNTEDIFDGYIAASFYKISKSDAIKKVINDNKINQACYIGDTIKDMEAATSANITFVQAKYGFGEELNSEYSINNINELPFLLNSIL